MPFEGCLVQNLEAPSHPQNAPKTRNSLRPDAVETSLDCPLPGSDRGGRASAEPFPAEGLASPQEPFVRVPPVSSVPRRAAAAGEYAVGRGCPPQRARR